LGEYLAMSRWWSMNIFSLVGQLVSGIKMGVLLSILLLLQELGVGCNTFGEHEFGFSFMILSRWCSRNIDINISVYSVVECT
jgi:hypothetical protein